MMVATVLFHLTSSACPLLVRNQLIGSDWASVRSLCLHQVDIAVADVIVAAVVAAFAAAVDC